MSDTAEQKANEPKPVVFRKTKSEKWAVMGPVETLKKALDENEGKVEVLKKSGDTSDFTIVSLGSPFDVEGTQMCYGYDSLPDATGGDAKQASAPANASSGPAATPPPQDSSEPLPEFQGSAEDEQPF